MTKKIVRVVAYPLPPYIYPCFVHYATTDKIKCLQPGVEITVISDQLIRLGFQPTFMNAGNYSNMKHMLEVGAADISGLSSMVSDAGNLSITLPLGQSKLVFMVGHPRSSLTPSLLFYHCDWLLWLTVAASFVLCILYKAFHVNITTGLRTIRRSEFSSKFSLMAWGLSFCIFSSLYSNNLAITLAQHHTHMPFNNLDELSKKLVTGQCRFILSNTDANIYRPSDSWSNAFGLPEYDASAIVTAIEKAVLFDDENRDAYLAKIMEEECNIGLAYSSFASFSQSMNEEITIIEFKEMTPITFVFYLNNVFKMENENRLSLLNCGSIRSLYTTYLEKILERNRHDRAKLNKPMLQSQSLKLDQLKDTFYILLSGMAASLLSFLFTLLIANFKNCPSGQYYFAKKRFINNL